MSARRRSRKRKHSSQPLSQTSSAAENLGQLKVVEGGANHEPIIRYAETDQDVIAIHRFLLVVAMPMARGPVDAVKSLEEVIRVVKFEAALMAIEDGVLVGTMGIVKQSWWYGPGSFMTERWHFVIPGKEHSPAAKMMLDEALAIAREAGIEFIHQGRIRPQKRGLTVMMPRSSGGESAIVDRAEG